MKKIQKLITALQNQVAAIRQGQKTYENFCNLGRTMEAVRDYIRDHQDGPECFETVYPLIVEAWTAAQEARKAGLISEGLCYDIGMLMNCAAAMAHPWEVSPC